MTTAALIREVASYHLRRAKNSDEGFLLELYAQGRTAELALSALDAMQREVFVQMQFRARQLSYTANYPMASDEIICSDSGTPVGRVLVDRSTDGMRLVDIALVATKQRHGFGTRVIQALQQECQAQGWDLKLQVLKGCAAESLYTRLGFEVVGEDSLRKQMVWMATERKRPHQAQVKRVLAGLSMAVLAVGSFLAQAQTAPANNVQSTTAPLAAPAGIAYDAAGNLYIADLNDNVIRKVDVAGMVTTVAGTGEQGFAGDGGPATDALLDSPAGIAVDATGNIYIGDTHNSRIRKVSGGTITTIAGTGISGFSGDGGSAGLAELNHPTALATDGSGNVYIADTGNHRIRKISGTVITTVAGNGEQFFSGDGAAAIGAGLDSPNGVAVDAAGNIYIGDTHNQRVRMVNASGIISTLGGNGSKTYAGDGTVATDASLARPRGLSIDALGNIYVADSDNQRIRMIATTGNITTVAGNGSQGFAGDGGPAVDATLDTPRAPVVQTAGVFALSDTHNQVVRKVSLDGTIQTIAGVSSGTGGGTGVQRESLILNGASTIAYGSGSLAATFANAGLTATGQVSLLDITIGSTPVGSASLNGNSATINTSTLSAGTHQLVASYGGDVQNAPITSSVFVLTVTALPVTATANGMSLQYGQAIPALTGTLSGVLPQDVGNLTPVFVTTATAISPVGQYPITVTLTGSAAGDYTAALASGSGSVEIGRAASKITLGSSNTTPFLDLPVILTAQVASTTTGTPTGNVTFYDATTLLATVPLSSSDTATYTSSTLAAGAHSIIAVYSGDASFTTSTSTATIETVNPVSNFTLTANGALTQSVNPGQTPTYSFTLQPLIGTFTSPVTLTASGLPAGATAVFTPATIPPGSGTTSFSLAIQTQPLKARNSRPSVPAPAPLLPISAVALLVPILRSKRIRTSLARMPRTLLSALFLLIAGAGALGLTGCGSGGFFAQSPQTYQITVTATTTSTANTTLQKSAVVTLIVQ